MIGRTDPTPLAALPSPQPLLVFHVEHMKLAGRLALAALGAITVSAGLAACYEHTLMRVTIGEFRGIDAETTARIHAAVTEDAEHDTVKLARVLVPLAMVVVWWREKRKERKR
jgi:hypothetical protein